MFTGAENAFLVRSAARAGVLGVVRKSQDAASVIDAVRLAASGGQGGDDRLGGSTDGDPSLSDVGLSPRQEEVLTLYASGEKARRRATDGALGADGQRLSGGGSGRSTPMQADQHRRRPTSISAPLMDGCLAPRGRIDHNQAMTPAVAATPAARKVAVWATEQTSPVPSPRRSDSAASRTRFWTRRRSTTSPP